MPQILQAHILTSTAWKVLVEQCNKSRLSVFITWELYTDGYSVSVSVFVHFIKQETLSSG